jgi:hypothetical protein
MRTTNGRTAWLIAAAACTLMGCAHYKVTDPSSGKVYYTDDVDRDKKQGRVTFTDAKTGAEVTLQSSDVQKISKEEYETGIGKK